MTDKVADLFASLDRHMRDMTRHERGMYLRAQLAAWEQRERDFAAWAAKRSTFNPFGKFEPPNAFQISAILIDLDTRIKALSVAA